MEENNLLIDLPGEKTVDHDSMEFEIQEMEKTLQNISRSECSGLEGNILSEDKNKKRRRLNGNKEKPSQTSGSDIDGHELIVDELDQDSDSNSVILNYNNLNVAQSESVLMDCNENVKKETVVENKDKLKKEGNEKIFEFKARFSDSPLSLSLKKPRSLFATSTPTSLPFRSDAYVTPAKSVLRKWRPSLLKRNRLSVGSTAEGDLSGIENIPLNETPKKSKETEFEQAMRRLQAELAKTESDRAESGDESDCAKLERYHETVVAQREQDDEKFDEILLEVTNHQVCYVVDEVGPDLGDETNEDEDKTLKCDPLKSTILEAIKEEDEGEGDASKPNSFSDKCLKTNDTLKKEFDTEENAKVAIESKELINEKTVKSEANDKSVIEVVSKKADGDESIVLPVNNGEHYITYLSSKDMALDDDEDSVVEIDDVLSLACSESFGSEVGNADDGTTVAVAATPHSTGEDVAAVVAALTATAKSTVTTTTASAKALPLPTADFAAATSAVTSSAPKDIKFEEFISEDPVENKDNNDPEWEFLRRLSTDKERYRALRERWHSMIIPDPNLDLTHHSFRVRKLNNQNRGEYSRALPGTRKRGRLPDPVAEAPAAKRRKCTDIFDETIDELLYKMESKRYNIHYQMNKELEQLAVKQQKERYSTMLYQGRQQQQVLHFYHTQEVQSLKNKFNKELAMAERETCEYINLLRAATQEIKTFHMFYENLDSSNANRGSLFLTDSQLQELVEVEVMIDLYTDFYNAEH